MLRQTMERIDKLLDGQTSDSEFNRQLENSRFLRECKAKGFKGLEDQGLIAQRHERGKRKPFRERKELACQAADLVNNQLISIHGAVKRLGSSVPSLQSYCAEFGFTLKTRKEQVAEAKRIRDKQAALKKKEIADREQAIFETVRKLIKKETIGNIVEEVGVSRHTIKRILLERGYELCCRKLAKVKK